MIAKDEQIKVEGKTNHFQYDKQKESDRVITIPKNNHKSIENEIKIQGFGVQTNKVNEAGKELRVPGDIWDPFGIPPKE